MNAVNFQKAKGAPLAIKKNISSNITQTKGASMGQLGELSDKEYQFLKKSKSAGLTKEEAVVYIQEKRKPTILEQVGQVGKDVAGGTLSGFAKLPTNIVGGALKGLGSIPVAPGMDLPDTSLQNKLKTVGSDIIRSGENTAAQNINITGARPQAVGTQIGEFVAPLAASVVASGPLGLTKAGAGAFQTAKAGIAARSLPTIAKGVAQGALVGGAEQAMFDVAQQGKTTPGNVALGATIGGVLPVAVPLIQQGAKATMKGVKNVVGGASKSISDSAETVANKMLTNMNRITKKEQSDFAKQQGKTVGEFLNERGIVSGGLKTVDEMSTKFVDSIAKADEGLEAIPGVFKNKYVSEMADEAADYAERTLSPQANRIRQLAIKAKNEGISMPESNEIKRFYERNNKFTYGKDITAGEKSARATNLDNLVRERQLDTAEQMGFGNLKQINKETQGYKFILDKLIKNENGSLGNNSMGLTDWIVAGQAATDPAALSLLVGKKVAESNWFRSGIVKILNKLSSHKNIGEQIVDIAKIKSIKSAKDLDNFLNAKALPAPKATVIPGEGLPQVKTPISPAPGAKVGVMETGMENVRQPLSSLQNANSSTVSNMSDIGSNKGLVVQPGKTLPTKTEAPLAQVSTEAPKLPVAKKTPLVKATDSTSISPKLKKPLIKAQVVSKVDDALLDFNKPMKSGDIQKLKKLQYSGDEGFQKVVDEFNINLKESNMIDDVLDINDWGDVSEAGKPSKLLSDILSNPKGFKIDSYFLREILRKWDKTGYHSDEINNMIDGFVKDTYKRNGITDDLIEEYANSSAYNAQEIIKKLKGKVDDALPTAGKMEDLPQKAKSLEPSDLTSKVSVTDNEYGLLSDIVDIEKGKPHGGWGMSIDKKQVGQYKSLEDKGIIYIDSMGQGDFAVKFTDKGKDIISKKSLVKVDESKGLFSSIRKTSNEKELSQMREQYGSTKGTILRQGNEEYVVTRKFDKATNKAVGRTATKQVRNADGTVTPKGSIGGGDTVFSSQKEAQQQINNVLSKSNATSTPAIGKPVKKAKLPMKADEGLTLYHGTNAQFDEFLESKISSGKGGDVYGKGVYLSESKDAAKTYADMGSKIPDADWYDFNKKISSRPYSIEEQRKMRDAFVSKYGKKDRNLIEAVINKDLKIYDNFSDKKPPHIAVKEAKEGGYDGISYQGYEVVDDMKGGFKNYVIFDPKKVKIIKQNLFSLLGPIIGLGLMYEMMGE